MEDRLPLPDPQQRFRIDLVALRTTLRRQILIVTYRVHIAPCKFSRLLDWEALVK